MPQTRRAAEAYYAVATDLCAGITGFFRARGCLSVDEEANLMAVVHRALERYLLR